MKRLYAISNDKGSRPVNENAYYCDAKAGLFDLMLKIKNENSATAAFICPYSSGLHIVCRNAAQNVSTPAIGTTGASQSIYGTGKDRVSPWITNSQICNLQNQYN